MRRDALLRTVCCHIRLAALVLLAVLTVGTIARAEDAEIARRRAQERVTFTDQEIFDGFFKVTFGAELHMAGRTDRIRKFTNPIRVFIDGRGHTERHRQVTHVIADIRSRIRNIDLAVTERRSEANVTVTVVRDRELGRAIRAMYGSDHARMIQRSLEPQCLSGFRKDESYRIVQADVLLVSDAGNFIFYDCAYEELLQALGPINDDLSVPWTMFNDKVQFGFFDVYDQYILNLLYHPRIRPGMTRDEAAAVLPTIMPEVRAWIAEVNGLEP